MVELKLAIYDYSVYILGRSKLAKVTDRQEHKAPMKVRPMTAS